MARCSSTRSDEAGYGKAGVARRKVVGRGQDRQGRLGMDGRVRASGARQARRSVYRLVLQGEKWQGRHGKRKARPDMARQAWRDLV